MRLITVLVGLFSFLTAQIASAEYSIAAGDERFCPLLNIWEDYERDQILSHLENDGHPVKAQYVKLQTEFCHKFSHVLENTLSDAEQAYRDEYTNGKVMPYELYAFFSELNRLSNEWFSKGVSEDMPNGITYEYASMSPICELGISLNLKEFNFMLNTMLTPESDPIFALIKARLAWCRIPNADNHQKAEKALQIVFLAAQNPNLKSEADLIYVMREMAALVKEEFRATKELAKQQLQAQWLGNSFAKGATQDNEICGWMEFITLDQLESYKSPSSGAFGKRLNEYLETRLQWCISPTAELDDRANTLWKLIVRDESKAESERELRNVLQ